MNTSAILSAVPEGFWFLAVLFVLFVAVSVLYALYSKGDVRAEFSHGSTLFRLEAKDRGRRRR